MSTLQHHVVTADDVKNAECIHVSFHAQARKTPDAVCLVDGLTGVTYNYRTVQFHVLKLAQQLRDDNSSSNSNSNPLQDRVVAIYMEACPYYIISMLGVLTAGAAYVPLELAYPTTMLQRVLSDATPIAVVTNTTHRGSLPQTKSSIYTYDSIETNVDDALFETYYTRYETVWKDSVALSDLAFIVYSSGTTGQPKGICNPHSAPSISYNWRFQITDYSDTDVVACYVFFVWECLRPLLRGGAVLPVPTEIVLSSTALLDFLQHHGVTEMLFTPSLLENVFFSDTAALATKLTKLKTVFLNGEVVSIQLRDKCLSLLPSTTFYNLYSISECHEIGVVDLRQIKLYANQKFCPIGYPSIPDHAYIVNPETMERVPIDEAGELYMGGSMLARGYLNLPQLTSERFVPDPFCPLTSPLMYRTGDRARWLPNGQLEILGRCDFMVKIRGYSIVLGAVEAALLDTVALTSCVVVADGGEDDDDESKTEHTDKHLVAYLVRGGDDATKLNDWTIDSRTGSCRAIRRAVDGVLPHYMIPSIFIEVASLPVSAVGSKLDRKKLQDQGQQDRRAMLRSLQLSADTHSAGRVSQKKPTTTMDTDRLTKLCRYLAVPKHAPLDVVQDVMLTVWQIVLGETVDSMEADFHECGGHSLSAARLVALLNQVYGGTLIFTALRLMKGCSVQDLCSDVVQAWQSGSTSVMAANDPHETARILQQVRDAAVLPEDLQFHQTSAPSLRTATHVLMTGATGYLGGHVLHELLQQNETCRVSCVVRSADRNCVRDNLGKYSLPLPDAYAERITVLASGDLAKEQYGYDAATWTALLLSVDVVVHCGAVVSLTAPYEMLAKPNVRGTLTAIQFVQQVQERPCSLVYVSTNGIYPTSIAPNSEVFLEDDDIECLPDRLGPDNGYGLSKWAAERLVTKAQRRGMNGIVLRYGNIGWQRGTGIGNALDYQGLILNGCRTLGCRPQVSGWQFEVTPVDVAAQALIALSSTNDDTTTPTVYNCVQSTRLDADVVFGIVDALDENTLDVLEYNDWMKRVQESGDILGPLQAFVAGVKNGESYLAETARIDCSKLDQALVSAGVQRLSDPTETEAYYKSFLANNVVLPVAISKYEAVPVDPTVTATTPVGPLAGKVAVVTGASSGIGRAIVLALAQAGCHVAMGARRVAELEKTHQEVAAHCPGSAVKTVSIRTDVTKQSDVARLVKGAEVKLGPVDILVNCAGVMYFTLMKNVVWDQWDQQVDVNCKGTMYGVGTVLPDMLRRGSGHIVNITSDAGRKAFAGLGVYSGSKFFVEAMSQALRVETASTGLRVTCIQPGNVATALLSKSTDRDGLNEYGAPSGAKVLEPADIGRAVVYALTQPEWCAVNEILVEPREEPA